jgi:hypothetical protein
VEEPNVITADEAARRRGCTRQAIYNALDRGDLAEVKMVAQRLVAVDDAFRISGKGDRRADASGIRAE